MLPWESNINLTVPHFLMASYLYYIHDESLYSDHEYDALCRLMDKQWDSIKHPHKIIIDRDLLKAGSAFDLRECHYPLVTQSSAWQLLQEKG